MQKILEKVGYCRGQFEFIGNKQHCGEWFDIYNGKVEIPTD